MLEIQSAKEPSYPKDQQNPALEMEKPKWKNGSRERSKFQGTKKNDQGIVMLEDKVPVMCKFDAEGRCRKSDD